MPVHNNEIAALFEKLADLLEIEGANPFRVRAYRNAARTVRGYGKSMSDLLNQQKDLSTLPGIGEDLAKKIRTIVETGKLPALEEVESRTPPALSDLMKIEGLGPKRIKILHKELGIQSLDDLKRAARSGKIREIRGFGRKTEQLIRERVEHFAGGAPRTRLIEAEEIAATLVDYLRNTEGVKDVIVAGSYRRRKETVGDLDILVSTGRNSPVMDRFSDYDEVDEVVSKGKTRSTVRLRSGMQVDLRVVPQISYGAALHYFTGSKAHNIAVRKLGLKKGCKINEYGVFRDDERIAGRTEEEVYEQVGLPYIPPELRENRGEIEAARADRLPELVRLEDIRGDLHCHSNASDGQHSLKQMAEAAAECGYEYLSINDHSRHVTVAHGLDKKRLLEQIREIDKLNERLDGIVLLKSIELDILENGSLDLPDSVLKELDFTVCAVHYKFNLSRSKQTQRILRAMDNPYFNILAHPTGRLINEREPYEIDLGKIMEVANERGCILELNAHPYRLDLTDESCMMAREVGVKMSISTDSHSTSNLNFMRFGINQARRGWLEAKDVINTLGLADLKKVLMRDG
ncbi:MAG: DNA polymerase/3'-5' exonuclease PolX [Pseudomonadota bacterium]|nr:DNA polymerase/3'-5' exonuclease PolX [Pseudomonadota bacterium]